MKGAIEFYLLLIWVLISLVIGFDFMANIYKIHQLHLCRDALVYHVDSFDDYNVQVAKKIDEERSCKDVNYRVERSDDRFRFYMNTKLKFSFLDLQEKINLEGFTHTRK